MQAALVPSLTVWTRRRIQGNSKYSGHDTDVTCFHLKRLFCGATFGLFGGVSSLKEAGMMVSLTSF